MPDLAIGEMLARIALAFAAGFLVGWERESHGRPAGLRTNILACVAAAVAMILAEELVRNTGPNLSGAIRADPARLGAGILAGIGFLGGGTIMRHENFIRGVTTAATLWTVTILGLAFGAGLFVLGLFGLAFALGTLLLLSWLEKRFKSDWYSSLTIVAPLDSLSEADWRDRIDAVGVRVQDMKIQYDLVKKEQRLTCDIKLDRPRRFELSTKVMRTLAQVPGVRELAWN